MNEAAEQGTSPHGAMPRDLLLVRHGRSEGNVALDAAKPVGDGGLGDDSKVLDPAYRERSAMHYRLVAAGREQAAAAGRIVREWMEQVGITEFDRCYCSPYTRAMETAALMGVPDARWRRESLLRERDFGVWEGRSRQEIRSEFPAAADYKDRNRYLYRPTGGESLGDVELRVREVLATLAREMEGRRVLCVTHEDVMWAFRYRLEKMTIADYLAEHDQDAAVPNGGILHFTRERPDGSLDDRFHRVRLVDPDGTDGWDWTTIERNEESDAELLAEVDTHPRLWGDSA